ncbi:MAG: acyl-CoA dehydrogenase family protein [Acidimicrobiales bacterium]|jgi:alkylation response protein AidB-like acyl-CoA dehydrogenase|nr:acyl-CoA dehydrogenase family protein [Acidimicrobiales bacterium]
MAVTEDTTTDSVLAELRTWLDDNWDPDLTLAEWWERLGLSGWCSPTLPENAYGKGMSRSDANKISKAIAEHGAVGAMGGLGLLLAAPTIATHGTQEQIDTYVRDIVTGQQAWCQLFSEPGAGSDLAGLTTKAERDGEEWIVNGQKVWTSLGQTADMGMLIARTNPDAPKHQGITWFACDMHQEGVELRPLLEMTGHAMFNEVFLTDARVPDSAVIGDTNNGWAATNTTLMHERAGLGSGGGGGGSGLTPGTIGGMLDKRAGDYAPDPHAAKTAGAGARRRASGSMMEDLAKALGQNTDPLVRQDLVRLHIMTRLGQMNTDRLKAVKAGGGDIPGMGNISKLAMSDMMRLTRDLGLRLIGPMGTLHGYTPEQTAALNEATDQPLLPFVTGQALYAQAPSIYGGTDEIQKNIIGERVLGLPKEPGDLKTTPFSELPKNA